MYANNKTQLNTHTANLIDKTNEYDGMNTFGVVHIFPARLRTSRWYIVRSVKDCWVGELDNDVQLNQSEKITMV